MISQPSSVTESLVAKLTLKLFVMLVHNLHVSHEVSLASRGIGADLAPKLGAIAFVRVATSQMLSEIF